MGDFIMEAAVKYRRFEELPVWNAAVELALAIFDLADDGCFQRRAGLRDQIERAVLSISNNIAEGFLRGTRPELLSFLYIARGSVGEVRSMLAVTQRLKSTSAHHEKLAELYDRSADVGRQMNAWIDALKQSSVAAPRARTRDSRRGVEAKDRSNRFMEKLRQIQEDARSASQE